MRCSSSLAKRSCCYRNLKCRAAAASSVSRKQIRGSDSSVFVFFRKLSRFCYGRQNRRGLGWFYVSRVMSVVREIIQIRKMGRVVVAKNQLAIIILKMVPISKMF
jgi:hypothetical protein